MDWICSPWRGGREISYIWKAVLDALDVIRMGMACDIGRGDHFRIERDSWPGCGMDFILPPTLLVVLDHAGILFL